MTVLVGYLLLFVFLAVFFVFIHLMIGKLFRPAKMDPEKATIYECGEPTIGSAWIQFDLRFYVIALLFVVFDVEVAFFFPWAVVFGNANNVADTQLPPQRQAEAFQAIIPAGPGYPDSQTRDEVAERLKAQQPGEKPTRTVESVQAAAKSFARVAFFDILVFFGVLLVGFAYLWKRGDLVWVRSTAAEQLGEAAAEETEAREKALAGGAKVPAGAAS
ncbi:MAG TPA: NADH-quinone oxidoreductase subunit A [Gemmataceae bacterium]|nr:NADH-quinone oxidoreductase subunit A [Gemmataceae bacterium]